jgi:hypothetical protein
MRVDRAMLKRIIENGDVGIPCDRTVHAGHAIR